MILLISLISFYAERDLFIQLPSLRKRIRSFAYSQNAFIASFKSKQLLLGGPISAEKSVMNLFNYED